MISLRPKSVSSQWCLNYHQAVVEVVQIAMEHFAPRQCSLINFNVNLCARDSPVFIHARESALEFSMISMYRHGLLSQ